MKYFSVSRIREIYHLQEQERKNRTRLSRSKGLRKCHLLHWRHPSGHSAFVGDSFKRIVEEVAKVIESKPDERFLVVSFKPRGPHGEDDVQQAMLSRVTNHELASFITWGELM